MNTLKITCYITSLLALSCCQAVAQHSENQLVTDTVTEKAASGDVRGLLNALPDLELLRKKEPLTYLKTVITAAPALRASSDPEVKRAALSIFENVLATAAPTDTDAAANHFRLKDKIISGYFELEEVRSNKERLLMVADFLGEIRSRRIPNYKNKGTKAPGIEILISAGVMEAKNLTDPEQKAAYNRAVEQNKEDLKMNDLQLALFSADSGLTFALIATAKDFRVKKSENQDFYESLTKRAKLTPLEMKDLGM